MALYSELKRRNVFRVAAGYGVVAWLLVQAGDILLGNFGAPDWVFKSLVVFLAIGFIVALVLAWAYELTPEGIQRTSSRAEAASPAPGGGFRRMDVLIMAGLVLIIGVLVVERFWPGSDAPQTAAAALAPTIAVLPFANLSADPEQKFFVDGLSEEVLYGLARIEGLRVTGRTSSFAFEGERRDLREIAGILGVAHLLEGSVRRAGDQLRVSVQLIQAEDGFQIWSHSYDRRLDDVFRIQQEIAEAIASALRLTLVGSAEIARPAPSIDLYQRYLEARIRLRDRSLQGMERAREVVDEILLEAPDYVPALAISGKLWLHLSEAYGAYGTIPLTEAIPRSRADIDRALALDPVHPDALAAMGFWLNHNGRPDEALTYLDRAVAGNPSHSEALMARRIALRNLGRVDEARAASLHLAELDPLFLVNLMYLAYDQAAAGDWEQAWQTVERMRRANPESYLVPRTVAGLHMARGNLSEALGDFQQVRSLAPGNRAIETDLAELRWALYDLESLAAERDEESVRALISLGRQAEALDLAEALWAERASLSRAVALVRGLIEHGQIEAALQVMESPAVPRDNPWQLALLILVLRESGMDAEYGEQAAVLGAMVAAYESMGYEDLSSFRDLMMGYAIVSDVAGVRRVMERALDLGLAWAFPLDDLAFRTVRDDPVLQELAERMNAMIDLERAKLGWSPLAEVRRNSG